MKRPILFSTLTLLLFLPALTVAGPPARGREEKDQGRPDPPARERERESQQEETHPAFRSGDARGERRPDRLRSPGGWDEERSFYDENELCWRQGFRAVEEDPAWFPEGRRIVYAGGRGGARDLFVRDLSAPGLPPTRLTRHPADDREPTVSPSGRWVAYISERDGRPGLYAVRSDGSDLRCLVRPTGRGIARPAWSPDGRWIAFTVRHGGGSALFRVSTDGAGRIQRLGGMDGPALYE